jgi:hypothetical protein
MMIGRFFLWTILLLIAGGVLLYYQVELPHWLSRVGALPGDLWIKKDEVILYFPLTSAMITAFVVSVIFSLFSKNKR